jgi:hypothetical protein
MNWDAISAVGQVLGSIAVFVTLGYLAVQVRQARRELRRSISESRAQMMRDFNVARINNAALAAATRKVSAAFETPPHPFITKMMDQAHLTEAEALLLFEEQWAYWRYRSHVISYVDDLPPGERVEFDRAVRFANGSCRGASFGTRR